MKYPLTSFTVAILLYSLLLLAFTSVFSGENQAPEVSLVIDANLIGEVNHHSISKAKKQKPKDLQKISDQKKYQESNDEQLEPQEEHPINKEEESKKISQKIAPIYQPLPEIPDELRLEAFNSKVVARFFILVSGEVSRVELVQPSAEPRLNHLLLKSLRSWKFPPNSSGFIQEINVTFKVE